MKNDETPLDMNKRRLGRRSFVMGAGFTGAGLMGATVASRLGLLDRISGAKSLGFGSSPVEAATYNDVDILNFALNLEYLEAEFYTVATTGKTLEQSGFDLGGTGKSGPTTGGNIIHNWSVDGSSKEASGKLQEIAEEIAKDEQAHVKLLRSALGSDAVAKPAINLDALMVGFGSFRQFIAVARALEDTGTSAYGGAAPLIASKSYLGVAVQIGLLEALHSANLRLLVAENYIDTSALDSHDILPPPSGSKYFEASSLGLTVVRTPSEVLAIVYGKDTSGTDKGGFFPDGVNGFFTAV